MYLTLNFWVSMLTESVRWEVNQWEVSCEYGDVGEDCPSCLGSKSFPRLLLPLMVVVPLSNSHQSLVSSILSLSSNSKLSAPREHPWCLLLQSIGRLPLSSFTLLWHTRGIFYFNSFCRHPDLVSDVGDLLLNWAVPCHSASNFWVPDRLSTNTWSPGMEDT